MAIQTEKTDLSWMERLTGVRLESSARVPSDMGTVKKAAPPTFIPDMILKEVWTRDNLDHIKQVATQDPIAVSYTHLTLPTN